MYNVFWILVSVVIVVLLQALVLGRFALRGVTYERYFTRTKLYEGEEMEMVEVISNRKLLPVPWIKVEARVPRELKIIGALQELDIEGDLYHRSSFTLAPYQRITRRHRVQCTQRGAYSALSAAMTAGDLFAFQVMTDQVEVPCDVIVYPAIVDASSVSLPSLKWQGDLVVKRFIMPDMFLYGGIRDYNIGDPIRQVHWGATAATGALKVKQNDYTAQPRLLILLNVQPTEEVWGEISLSDRPDIEQGLRVAAAIASSLIEKGLEVGFASNAKLSHSESTIYIEPACSYEQNEALLDCFAHYMIFRQRSFHQFLGELPRFSECDVLILSCYRSRVMDEAIDDLRVRGNSVSIHLLREEKVL